MNGLHDSDSYQTNSQNQSDILDEPTLLIYIIDVGQGDATLILGPVIDGERASLLIDAGGLDPDGGEIIANFLQTLPVEEIQHLVLTHYDGDHMGGFVTAGQTESLLWDADCTPRNYFPTQTMIDLGPSEKTTDSVLEYTYCQAMNESLLEQGHVIVGTLPEKNIGYTIELGSGFSAMIIAGNGYVLNREEQVSSVDTDNEKSIAVLVSGPDDFHFLVTGDLTGQVYGNEDAEVELALGEELANDDIDISILRVGHHGSATSSAPEFLQGISPEVAVISVGDNGYGHPHCSTLENLIEFTDSIFSTGGHFDHCPEQSADVTIGGTLLITVDSSGYSIRTHVAM